jgi:ABC-type antimicrobial peptide transport system permease subunit
LELFLAASTSLASLVALVLALIGLGADSVSLMYARRREIALRMCLGATRGTLVLGLVRERLWTMAAAAALAAVLLALLHPSLEETLPWYRPTDLMAVAAAIIVMMVAVLIGLAVLLRVNIKPDLAEELRRER